MHPPEGGPGAQHYDDIFGTGEVDLDDDKFVNNEFVGDECHRDSNQEGMEKNGEGGKGAGNDGEGEKVGGGEGKRDNAERGRSKERKNQ